MLESFPYKNHTRNHGDIKVFHTFGRNKSKWPINDGFQRLRQAMWKKRLQLHGAVKKARGNFVHPSKVTAWLIQGSKGVNKITMCLGATVDGISRW